MNNNIYKQVENHVTGLFETNKRPKLFFHTLEHTENIVQRAGEIADQYKLPENERPGFMTPVTFSARRKPMRKKAWSL
jgi:hypothetical protein